MKQAARCGFLLVGTPNLIGFVIATGLWLVLVRVVPAGRRTILLACMDFLSGFGSVLGGLFLSWLCGFQHAMWLPLLSCIWFAIHFGFNGRLTQFFLSAAGVLVAWMLCPGAMTDFKAMPI